MRTLQVNIDGVLKYAKKDGIHPFSNIPAHICETFPLWRVPDHDRRGTNGGSQKAGPSAGGFSRLPLGLPSVWV